MAAATARAPRLGPLLSLLLLGVQSAEAQHPLTARDLETFVDSAFGTYVRRSPEPRLAIVVVQGGAIVFKKGYGVDPDSTVFYIASAAKVVTAAAVLQQVERGQLDLDAPALPAEGAWAPITLRHLLTHTSGLDEPFMQGVVADSAELRSLEAYFGRLELRRGTPPGAVFRYSNHGVALAGMLLERASGAAFPDYMDRHVFAPLGMTQSTFRQPIPPPLAARLATAGAGSSPDFLLVSPAGAMVSTAADMGRFLAAQSRVTIRRQWTADPRIPGVALGWLETNIGGVRGLFHTGARHHFSVAYLAPEHRVGFFLVHSMRQGGPFRTLRSDFTRAFVSRYLGRGVTQASAPRGRRSLPGACYAGTYRPLVLATTTVERLGYLALDTRVSAQADGGLRVRLPGAPELTAMPIDTGLFEVPSGAAEGVRIAFSREPGAPRRMAMTGALMDPIVFDRLAWWERGTLHAAVLLASGVLLASFTIVWLARRGWSLIRHAPYPAAGGAWIAAAACGGLLIAAVLAAAGIFLTTPEAAAGAYVRRRLPIVFALLTAAAMLGSALPLVAAHAWRRHRWTRRSRVYFSLLAVAGVATTALLWHYRLLLFRS